MTEEFTAKLSFASDYMEGAHPAILDRMRETNLRRSAGYGLDKYSEAAREAIRRACGCPEAEVFFLVGGTQTNVTVIDGLLQSYQGVIAAESGHISVHEAGAIEFGGHKVLALSHQSGKIRAEQIERYVSEFQEDGNHDHMVWPGMVYLSQPTEYGTLYSLEELQEIRRVCEEKNLLLYLDGARLAYALACPENDVSLADLAKLCDVFYIGGTKCGALFGEAVVIPKKQLLPHFFTIMKQHGALLAKGRMLGIQFEQLFAENLYYRIGESALEGADRIRQTLVKCGYELCFDSPTNQIFVVLENAELRRLQERVEFSFWEIKDEQHTVVRFVTSWATAAEDVDALLKILEEEELGRGRMERTF